MSSLVPYTKRFSVSILLWMRQDKTRQTGMDYWKGPHSQIIASSPGLLEYRQQHLSENSHSFWPKASDLKTTVSEDRRVDGVAEVTFENLVAPIKGRKQTGMAFKDEVNVFRRTLMYMGLPFSSRWYETTSHGNTYVRDVLYLQRREGTSSRAFKKMVHETLASVLASSVGVTELRTQVYLPWSEKTWDTPNVAHDNPKGEHFHASIILGFASERERNSFYKDVAPQLNQEIIANTSAVFAYQMAETLTFVANGKRQKP